jgi:hypothetical protein
MSLQTDLEAAVAKAVTDSGLLHDVVHGPASGAGSTVATEGGEVKTVAKAIGDIETDLLSNNVVAQVTDLRDEAEAWAENPEDVEVQPGRFSALHHAAKAAASAASIVVTDYIRTLFDDPDAAAALTTLGVSAFIQTLLGDADAAAARGTLALGSAATKDTGIGDTQLPTNADLVTARIRTAQRLALYNLAA